MIILYNYNYNIIQAIYQISHFKLELHTKNWRQKIKSSLLQYLC